ncbi:hypothetical protein Shyhy01_07040 [Streptomyces hygroscopicus subsp. hygroscopicus]|nr:SAVMC3_10250 family protein [Streptomyces hygroscopicus]GLX47754.1 hypothetical protein Shyhy01_07040 [Streptomyces hygroscopicus subsp. hygroscopicus]
MQELVYLSDAKLRQFVPEGRRWTRIGQRLTALRLKTPTPVGEVSVEADLAQSGAEPGNAQRLTTVVGHVEQHALWYQDPSVRAGRWVYFEAPLNVFVIGRAGLETVLFVDAPAARGADDPGHQGGVTRLLLHGSPQHLLAPFPRVHAEAYGLVGSALHGVLWDLALDPPPAADRIDSSGSLPRSPGIIRLGRFLQVSNDNPAGAAWMRGYARVSTIMETWGDREGATGPRTVVATPLYVGYAPDLPD